MNMPDEIPGEVKTTLKELVSDIVQERFDDLAKDGRIGRLAPETAHYAIHHYPGHITMPPDTAFDKFDYMQFGPRDENRSHLVFDLWYDGQQSDLSLIAIVKEITPGEYRISIDDIHVL